MPAEDSEEPSFDPPPPDLCAGRIEPSDTNAVTGLARPQAAGVRSRVDQATDAADQDWVEPDLGVAALVRTAAGPPEQTDADLDRMFTRALAWHECPVSRDRMAEIKFVGRRHPRRTDVDQCGPKYLNTADTPLFHKGAQLFGAVEQHLADGGVPVIVDCLLYTSPSPRDRS